MTWADMSPNAALTNPITDGPCLSTGTSLSYAAGQSLFSSHPRVVLSLSKNVNQIFDFGSNLAAIFRCCWS